MPSAHDIQRVYNPDTLKIMTMAFDSAHECLPKRLRESDQARHRLALSAIRCASLIRPCWISSDNPHANVANARSPIGATGAPKVIK